MAKNDKKDSNTMLVIAGTAAVTAFVVWYVNKELQTRDELRRMKALEELKALKGAV